MGTQEQEYVGRAFRPQYQLTSTKRQREGGRVEGEELQTAVHVWEILRQAGRTPRSRQGLLEK